MPLPELLSRAPRIKVSGFEDVRHLLRGKVFHVTRLSNLAQIAATGGLVPNDGTQQSPFGNTVNGYFRGKGCVSFFDYREFGSGNWKAHYSKCLPTLAISPDDPAIVMQLRDDHHDVLQSWMGWKTEERWGERVVPYIEIGYPGLVSLDLLNELQIWEHADPENARRAALLYGDRDNS